LPDSSHGQKPAGSSQNSRNLAGSSQIGWDSAIDLARIRPNLLAGIRQLDVAGFQRHLSNFDFSHFVIFFTSQMPKNIFEKIIFPKNDFVENVLRRKSFYVETNLALKTRLKNR
jgi:hypothetical protein